MKPAKKKKPQVVQGTVIGVSTLAMYGMMAVTTVLSVVGLGLVLAWFFTPDASIWLLLVGLFLVVVGPAGIAIGIYRMKTKERLVLGSDRFQIVHQVQGQDEVITQVPYSNISAIQFERGTQSNYVGIEIADLEQANTYSKNNDFPTTKSVRGFHVIIDPGYTEALGTIYDLLVVRAKPYQEQTEE